MTRLSAALLRLLLLLAVALPAAAQTPARPNIVLIVSDDQGWKDVGFHGSDIATPHLLRSRRHRWPGSAHHPSRCDRYRPPRS